jgi:uncharacterized protein YyaL (SSP411 family)
MEGAFYIWRDDEIQDVLGKDADLFRVRFGVRPDGNAPSDPQGEFTRKNLLYMARSLEEAASLVGRSPGEADEALRRAREALMARRATRPRPHLDDKILTAWNGLMIAAFARAARVIDGAESCLAEARRAATFLREHSWNASGGTLLRRVRQGEAGIEAYAEDYACLVFGLLELFQADADPVWLEWAIALQRRQDELFWDPIEGGWFSTTGRDESVLLRLKEDYDGAEPSVSSVGLLNLLTLTHLAGDQWSVQIEHTLRTFGPRLADSGRAAPMMLAALSTYHAGVHQVVIVGEHDAADTRALEDVVRRRYRPSSIVVAVAPSDVQRVSVLLPWISSMKAQNGRATAYVCRNFACEAPMTDAGALGRLLDGN